MDSPNTRYSTNRNPALSVTQFVMRYVMQMAAVFLLTTAAALAQVPFSIDGTVPDAGCCAEFKDPVGSIKELGPVNASNTKLGNIHLAAAPMLLFTNPNGATDIATIWLATETDPTGDIWLYFAWQRESSSGSSVMAYEFQTAAPDPACNFSAIDQTEPASAAETTLMNSCNPWSNRQAGDFMVVWDFGGGATDIILRTFNGISFNVGVNLSASGFATASLNVDSSRGEGAINLTDAIFGNQDACFNFANVIPGTITGNSDQADYKDTVLADIASILTISNCGTVNITKATQPAGETGNFAYTLQRAGGADIDYTPRSSASGVLIDDGGSAKLVVVPGSDYQLTEDLTGEPRFELQSILCSNPAPGTDGTAAFGVNAGETTDCVITNELLTGTITVIKQVVSNYGGSAQSADFCIDLNDDQNTPFFAGDDTGTQFTFAIGNQYNVAEVACGNPDTSPPGYMASYAGECSGVIEARTDKVCTITNTQQPQPQAGFALLKNVINNNGGKAVASAWTVTASLQAGSPGSCTASGMSGSGGGVNGSLSVSDNVAQCVYELAEAGGPASGYAPVGWSCTGNVSLNGNKITLGSGGGSCTITNDDQPPSLTLVKQVRNDNGGTVQANAWTLSAAGPTPISGAGSVSSGSSFSAGTYVLSEIGAANYLPSGWGCQGGSQTGNSITLGLGESATCTIMNDDIQPTLKIVKNVINDNGGVLTASAFPLFINNVQVQSGVANPRNAGNYQVSETNLPGYLAGVWGGDCATDGTVQLRIGDNKTCTITNNDLPPKLKIEKSPVSPFITPGETMAYSIVVTNIGGGDALGVTLTDALPPINNADENLPPLPWTTTTAGCTVTQNGATLTCNIGTLAKDPTFNQIESGDEAKFTVQLTVTVPANYLDAPSNPGGSGTLGSHFEIDGNLMPKSGGGLSDWGSAGLSLLNVLDPPLIDLSPAYPTDDSFTEGSKEDTIVPVVLDHSIPPNKSDLTNFLIAQEDVDGNGFLALGWIRANSLGTANFDFELNQSENLTDNGITPVRTNGDVLFSFDYESSGNVVMITLREWDGTAQQWGQARSLNIEGTGYAATNDSVRFGTVLNGEINPFGNQLLPDQTFGEAIINLTETFDGNCRTFLNAYVKGRSSTAFTASLKDFIAPISVEISTCRTIDVLNIASSDATNPGQDPVSDDAVVTLSNDPRLTGDPDQDGLRNYVDPDDDGDGVNDGSDAFPLDPTEWADSDGDRVGDNADAFPNDPTETKDTDGDGVGNNADAFPNDPAETMDTDGDGVGDNGDAFPNDPSESRDTDGDGVGDNGDDFPTNPNETRDSDNDGVGDNGDAFPNDSSETADSDGDGVGNNADAFPNDSGETLDTDGDGIGDNSDPYPTGRYLDVPMDHWAFLEIEVVSNTRIWLNCSNPGMFCPDTNLGRGGLTRALLRARHGGGYVPPPATGKVFTDVPATHWAAAWIEQAKAEGIVDGCGSGKFCPDRAITRAEMARFVLKARNGGNYIPPMPTGMFADVPVSNWYDRLIAAYIEQLARENISSGCGNGNFCPNQTLTRAEIAVQIYRTFGL